jgi:hypothetical protein
VLVRPGEEENGTLRAGKQLFQLVRPALGVTEGIPAHSPARSLRHGTSEEVEGVSPTPVIGVAEIEDACLTSPHGSNCEAGVHTMRGSDNEKG